MERRRERGRREMERRRERGRREMKGNEKGQRVKEGSKGRGEERNGNREGYGSMPQYDYSLLPTYTSHHWPVVSVLWLLLLPQMILLVGVGVVCGCSVWVYGGEREKEGIKQKSRHARKRKDCNRLL